jgi:YHS domain-containing protein
MQLDPAPAGPTVTYAGMNYRFCSTHCRDAFTSEPQRYHQTVGH